MKQETLEEAAETYSNDWEEIYPELDFEDIAPIEMSKLDFIAGANWQAERMYSEEDLREAFRQGMENLDPDFPENMDYSEMYGWSSKLTEQEWFEQFKKK